MLIPDDSRWHDIPDDGDDFDEDDFETRADDEHDEGETT